MSHPKVMHIKASKFTKYIEVFENKVLSLKNTFDFFTARILNLSTCQPVPPIK